MSAHYRTDEVLRDGHRINLTRMAVSTNSILRAFGLGKAVCVKQDLTVDQVVIYALTSRGTSFGDSCQMVEIGYFPNTNDSSSYTGSDSRVLQYAFADIAASAFVDALKKRNEGKVPSRDLRNMVMYIGLALNGIRNARDFAYWGSSIKTPKYLGDLLT